MPIDYNKYPKDWKQISLRIRERAGWKCENCGVPNKARGARDCNGKWWDEDDIHGMNSSVGEGLFGDFPKMIRIVLTVSHTNHDITDNSDENLKSLCQLCHLRHDAKIHAEHAKETRHRKKLEATQATGQTLMDV